MELKTISQISKEFDVSVRMLRYYEKEGLLDSRHVEDYAYRMYDEEALNRLRLILILRKLQIPVKQIKLILDNRDIDTILDVFKQNIGELSQEVNALNTIQSILTFLTEEIEKHSEELKLEGNKNSLEYLSQNEMLPLLESLSFAKYKIKENLSMDELNKASNALNELADRKELGRIGHPQEKLIESYKYRGIMFDIVEWSETIWCGKCGYAPNVTSEPDVDQIMNEYQTIDFPSKLIDRIDTNWDACLSINYLSKVRPNGVMFASLVEHDKQVDSFDIFRAPKALYARIRMNDETAEALGYEPWHGGIPPYQWLGEDIAPNFGYTYGDDTLPVIEYYGYYDPEKYSHEFCYLYVPIKKI